MAGPGQGGRVDYTNPLVTPRPVARPRGGGGRPMANGQPTYPEGMPPIPGAGGPTRASDQGIDGPLAGGPGPISNTGTPGNSGGSGATTTRGTPTVLDVADAIEADTLPRGRKNEVRGNGRH